MWTKRWIKLRQLDNITKLYNIVIAYIFWGSRRIHICSTLSTVPIDIQLYLNCASRGVSTDA